MAPRDRHADLQIHQRLPPRWNHFVFRAVEVHSRRELGAEGGHGSSLGEELDLELDGEVLPERLAWVRPLLCRGRRRTTDLESTHGGRDRMRMLCGGRKV